MLMPSVIQGLKMKSNIQHLCQSSLIEDLEHLLRLFLLVGTPPPMPRLSSGANCRTISIFTGSIMTPLVQEPILPPMTLAFSQTFQFYSVRSDLGSNGTTNQHSLNQDYDGKDIQISCIF